MHARVSVPVVCALVCFSKQHHQTEESRDFYHYSNMSTVSSSAVIENKLLWEHRLVFVHDTMDFSVGWFPSGGLSTEPCPLHPLLSHQLTSCPLSLHLSILLLILSPCCLWPSPNHIGLDCRLPKNDLLIFSLPLLFQGRVTPVLLTQPAPRGLVSDYRTLVACPEPSNSGSVFFCASAIAIKH